jgi:predicted Rossmann fold flavoprotein
MEKKRAIKYDLIVIGGGASGMMAAGTAAKNGKKVLILEKNSELGKKLKITGGGRCNITNATFDLRKMLAKFGKAEPFLYSPFSQFGVKDTFKFFEDRKLPLVVEARDRAFPETQKASDVFRVMYEYINNKNVIVIKNSPVLKMTINKETKRVTSVQTDQGTYEAHNFIIATGGASHPETGSTGDGFKWLAKIGHKVNKPSPNVVPLKARDKWIKDLSGTSLSFMKITFFVEGKKAFSETGKILFTHFGLSGPLILNSAHKVADLLHAGKVTAKIDCYPDTDLGSLEKQILKVFDQNKNKDFKNIVDEITPPGLGNTLIEFHIVPDVNTKVHSISKDHRKQIVNLLKNLPVEIQGLMGMDRAVLSDGGIPLTEVDTKTMKSKLFENLYLTGDILHINRPSGGYSLQLCWTTGYVAGLLK